MFQLRWFCLLRGVLCGALLISLSAQADLPKDYLKRSAEEKRDILWSQIQASQYDREELPSADLDSMLAQTFSLLSGDDSLTSLRATLNHTGDELPENKLSKFIHPYGTVLKVVYRADVSNSRLGVLGEPKVVGLLRLSLAAPYEPKLLSYIPGMALKLFVGGAQNVEPHPSLNVLAMEKLEGQGDDTHFFRHPFSTEIPNPKVPKFPLSLDLLSRLLDGDFEGFAEESFEVKAKLFTYLSLKHFQRQFEKATEGKPATRLPMSHLVAQSAQGDKVANPLPIYRLEFRPTAKVQKAFLDSREKDYRLKISEFPVGTPIYEVWYYDTRQSQGSRVGQLFSDSLATASDYGDHKLFFRHHMAP